MILTTAPWRRAPGLVFRAPAVVVAVVLAAGVLALAAASGPLFVSSTGSAAISREVGSSCPEDALPSLAYPAPDQRSGSLATLGTPAGLRTLDGTVRGAMTVAGLPAPERVLTGTPTAVVPTGQADLTLFSRAGALDHVAVTARIPGDGLVFSDLAAARLKLRLGDEVAVGDERAKVVGLYTDLNGPGFGSDVPRYWCTWTTSILTTLENRPPPFVLTDDETLVRLTTAGNPAPQRDVTFATWYAPVPADRITPAEAAGVVAAQRRLPEVVLERAVPLAYEAAYGGDLARVLDKATRERAGVAGPVRPTSLAGTLVALLLIAGAGAYWAERRGREVTLLAARGVGPVALAGKAVLEMVLPAVAGTAAGWFAARLLVASVGPSPRLEPGAVTDAARDAGLGLLGGLVLLGVAAVARQRVSERRRPDRRTLRVVPWELALLGAALWAYLEIRGGSGVAIDRQVISVSPLVIAWPLLALGGALVLAARVVGALGGALRRCTTGLGAPAYLAVRRLTAGGLVTLALGALVAVPAGVLAYGGVVTRSVEASVGAKSGLYTGAEQAVVTRVPPAGAIATGGHGTVVSVASGTFTAGTGVERDIGVVGVDPATFARYAYTGGLGYSLPDVLAELGGNRAVLVNCGCGDLGSVRLRTTDLRVDVVDRRGAFPGMRLLKSPTLVVARDSLARVDGYADRREEVWTTTAELPALSAVLAADRVPADRVKTPDAFLDVTDLLPLTWSLGYLQALALLTGVVGLAGLLLHLGARQRAATVAYPMLRRMGLGRGRHLASLAYELAVLLGVATVVGAALGVGAAALVHPQLDLDPDFAPPPLLVVPAALLAGLALVTAVLVAVAALATQRTADRIKPADALRVGG